jgi:hypothetical protein
MTTIPRWAIVQRVKVSIGRLQSSARDSRFEKIASDAVIAEVCRVCKFAFGAVLVDML